MSSDKFLSVFSRFAPNISLVFSMVLSFIPRLRKNAAEINEVRSVADTSQSRLKRSIANFSALISMTLEESVEVSDSMRARGFNKNRKAYSKYSFCFADGVLLAVEIILFCAVLAFCVFGKTEFIYEPVILGGGLCAPAFILFAAIYLLPIVIDFTEDMK
ncbi:MAG: energy-coupling factor transporter transmembrane protein EcfT [Clostridiales bacterium]|nr:energy-coupling factor transporter transmembrane protein EcfT [Clostridiales bacterium]